MILEIEGIIALISGVFVLFCADNIKYNKLNTSPKTYIEKTSMKRIVVAINK